MSIRKNRFNFHAIGVFVLLFSVFFLVFPVNAGSAGQNISLLIQKLKEVDLESLSPEESRALLYELKALAGGSSREYSEWERRIAQEVIATGEMLKGDPRFDEVVSALAARGQSMLPNGAGITQDWVKDHLRAILPELDHKMASAAMNAATNEVARGAGSMADGYARSQLGLSEGVYDVEGTLKQTAIRSGLEGAKAAAAASNLHALRSLELEYSLSGDGLDGYSALTVQPLWDSEDLRHNVFVQGSYANKEVQDLEADTSDRRDTVNAGLAYRYIMPDEQHMFGANAFFDHQWPYHHNRMSLGLDYKTSLYGVAVNKYIGLSDWRARGDGYEEKALGGEDVELSGRLPQAPELELFAKGYHWEQEKTAALNPDGDDIFGYQFSAEYTPINALTIRSSATRDNEMDDTEGEVTLRLNYTFGQSWDDLWERPSYNLDSVLDRRFEKVRRTNEIRVQVRQDPDITARVTFAQGANVSVGQSLAFGTLITTGAAAGDAATVIFGDGARLDAGQDTQVRIESERIVLNDGLIQFTSASGGITVIAVPGGTIDLIGTDVDVRVASNTTTLRVRDGAASFTDENGSMLLSAEELAEAQDDDGTAPQIRAESTAIYETHTQESHAQLDLVGPAATTSKAAPYADEEVNITGTLGVGNTMTFTVPLSASVSVSGSPQLAFTLGGADRLADYASGSGTTSLVFTYVVTASDVLLSNIVVETIEKNGGTLTGANGAAMVRTVSGSLSGSAPDTVSPTIASFSATGSSGDPASTGDVVTITLNANETLLASGTPTLTLDIGGVARTANFSAITSGNAEFTYTVQVSEVDLNGIEVTAINAAADELEDAYGNDLDTTFALPENLGFDVVTVMMGLNSCPSGDLSAPANAGCARLIGSDPTDMDDVMVYAGDVPGTTTDFFVRRCDQGMSWDGSNCTGTRSAMQWKDSLTISATAQIGGSIAWDHDSARNGPNNTALLVADGSGTHAAAESCAALSDGSWYLPAISEVDVMYANLIGTDDPEHPLSTVSNANARDNISTTGPLRADFGIGTLYWSSTEEGYIPCAWTKHFTDGSPESYHKTRTAFVRCARR